MRTFFLKISFNSIINLQFFSKNAQIITVLSNFKEPVNAVSSQLSWLNEGLVGIVFRNKEAENGF